MYYSKLVKKACQISFEAHKDDVDKGGYPYVYHPFFLATQMDDEITTCVALLHDVIEDHSDKYSFEYLKSQGFNKEIIDVLKLLTHSKDIEYMDYIQKIKFPVIGSIDSKNFVELKKVKIADLKHNLDNRRTEGVKSPKYELYKQALELLVEENKK